jgi:cellulose synthase/poly-beta-1,6-N-acetylglucosamine synthase-like glycosyltransferase
MEHKKIQFLVPQYKENEETISFLLNSLDSQIHIDKKDIGVIICSDGGEYILDKSFLDKYSYDIEYVICEHRGVSATRNSALILSDAEYVMFCDADDGFVSNIGVYSLMRGLDLNPNSEMMSSKIFIEETINDAPDFIIGDHNNTFVHGKVFRREFLISNELFFDERLKVHEDSYFCNIINFYAKNKAYNNNAFYCWRKNPNSVSNQEYYFVKTMWRLLLTNNSLVDLMKDINIDKGQISETVVDVVLQFYCELQNSEWYLEEHKEYLDKTYGVLYWYIMRNAEYYNLVTEDNFKKYLTNVRNAGTHYRRIEWFTVDQFIKRIESYKEYAEKMGDPYILN